MRFGKIASGIVGVAAAMIMLTGSPASAAVATGVSGAGTVGTAPAGAVPGSVKVAGTAATYEYSVTQIPGYTYCSANEVRFRGFQLERGFSGTQQFRQRATLQEFTSIGWVARDRAVANSVRFANDGQNRTFTFDWVGSHVNNGASWRVVWQGFYLNGAGAVIARTPTQRVTCL